MLRYQGVDWRDQANWACNKRCGVRGSPRPGADPLGDCTPAFRLLALPTRRPALCPAATHARCSANPYGEHYLDGVSLDPFEVMFVKVGWGWWVGGCRHMGQTGGGGPGAQQVPEAGAHWPRSSLPPLQVKERVLQNSWSFALQAVKYGQWMEAAAAGRPQVGGNAYRDDPQPFRQPRLAYMLVRRQRGMHACLCLGWLGRAAPQRGSAGCDVAAAGAHRSVCLTPRPTLLCPTANRRAALTALTPSTMRGRTQT